jgi:hypothetical protein
MELNFATLFILFLRLSPFVLLCFFSISSIFNNDLKGIVYLVGLLLAAGISLMAQGFVSDPQVATKDDICDIVSIGSGMFSKIPLGQTILGFTFAYLINSMLTTDANNPSSNVLNTNWPTIVFFISLIFFDLVMNTNIFNSMKGFVGLPNTYCYTNKQTAIAYAIGALVGLVWAKTIYKTDTPELLYFSKYKNNEVCSKASNKTFKCKVYKNGKLVSG